MRLGKMLSVGEVAEVAEEVPAAEPADAQRECSVAATGDDRGQAPAVPTASR
jgi:hypothetical protein